MNVNEYTRLLGSWQMNLIKCFYWAWWWNEVVVALAIEEK